MTEPATAQRSELPRDVAVSVVATAVAALCFSLAVRPARPPEADATLGAVAEARGAVRRRVAQALGWFPTGVNERVAQGDVLFAPAGAEALVRFDDGTELKVDEDSLVVVAPREGAAGVRVERGAVAVRSGQHGVVVSTPAGDVTVGAQASAALVTGAAGVELSVQQGEARLGSATVQQGQHTRVVGGQVATPTAWPVRLVAPAASFVAHFVGQPPTLDFATDGTAPDGAQVQVAQRRDFSRVLKSASAAAPLSFTPPRSGAYWWRVVDAAGQPVSDVRRFTAIEDVPPLPLRPLEGRLVQAPSGTAVDFAWAPTAGVGDYELELSNSARFTAAAAQATVRGSAAKVPLRLDEGVWYWRVRAGANTAGNRPWSRPSSFRLVHSAVPDAPELLAPEVEVDP